MPEKILLVEDESLIALNEAQMLKKHGYEVVTAYNGEKAVEAVDSDPEISLILMDIDLGSGMDGTEVAEKILTHHEIPIVFLTSHSEKEYVERVKGITRYGYVLKTSSEFVLIESINMAFELFEALQQLRKKEIEAQAVVDNIDSAVLRFNEKGEFIYFSKGAEKIFGYKAEEVIGLKGTQTINPSIDSGGRDQQKMLEDIFAQPEQYSYNENENVRKDGTKIWMAWRNKAVYDTKRNRLFMQCIGYDITDRKKNEKKLRKALEDKDFLMKELNHRVKNNLAMVSSLINLKDSETEIDLSGIQHQIEAIGLIHEKLYQTGNVTEIGCRGYISDLLNSVFSSFSRLPVRIEANIDAVSIPTKAAMSLGLIVNEIATNAIKHGFNEKEAAVFSVNMKEDRENNRYELILSNTGNPFPEEINIDNSGTLGLRLINALVAQIDGTIELQKKPHPVFTIRFPIGIE
jgi:PAS domain S-box-containing protein